jgi:hypothetical protein
MYAGKDLIEIERKRQAGWLGCGCYLDMHTWGYVWNEWKESLVLKTIRYRVGEVTWFQDTVLEGPSLEQV